MGSQDRWPDGEKKHKVWHIEGRGVCVRSHQPCGRKDGDKDFCYEKCSNCMYFVFENDKEKEITDYEPTQ